MKREELKMESKQTCKHSQKLFLLTF